ncbi:MAG TPA: cache domain-containing protein [Acetobacteraceae bacterium]|nr:cache domain-containing protein [Acetobacteraceae bacterium]
MTTKSRVSFMALLFATIVGPALLFAAMAWWTWDRVKRDTAVTISRQVELLNEDTRRLLQADAIILARVADRVDGLTWSEIATREPELSRGLADLIRGIAEIEGVFIADAQGDRQVSSQIYAMPMSGAATPAPTNANIADRPYFQAAKAGTELVVDGPFISRLTGQPIFSVVKRLSDHDGLFRGIAALNISPNHLTEFWRQLVSPGDSVSLVREDGTVLARFPDPPMASVDRPLHFSQIAMDKMRSAEFGQFDRTPSPIDGIARTLGYRRLPGYPLYIVSAVDRSNVVIEWLPSVLAFGVLALAAAVALLLSATAVIRRARSEEDALRRAEASEANYRALYARTPVPMHACDREGILTAVSDRWLELLGYERDEVIGHHITSFHTATSAIAVTKEWRHVIDAGGERDSEHQFVRKSGEILDVVISAQIDCDGMGSFRRILAFVTDVTAQRRAEAALRQAQRLEAVGQLTGGIAHDFNNLLLVVAGNAEMLRPGIHEERYVRALDAIDRASERGARLTRQLLGFSRQQALSPSVIGLSEWLTRLREMLAGTFRGGIAVEFDVPATIWRIEIDGGELELALLNIAVNARDAMPNGGKFVVSAKNVTLTGHSEPVELAGDFVALTLSDTGEGISPENVTKIFEPFFTTKPIGQGTGLGLSQVFGFARQSGGIATVETALGRGTSISLYFPRSQSEIAALADGVANVPAGGSETILVVEDDLEVAEVSRTLLQKLGYRTRLVTDAGSALEELASDPAIDLVFSDIMMPGGISGVELARTLRQRYPRLGVLLTTGYPGGAQEAMRAGLPLIRKPYQLEELGRQVRASLVRRSAALPADAAAIS